MLYNSGSWNYYLYHKIDGTNIQLEIAKILIEAGADVNYQGNTSLTALMISVGGWAIPKEYLEILLKSGANIDLRDNQGKNALMYAVRKPKFLEEETLQLEKAKLLIKAGANVNAKDNRGETALSCARAAGHTEIIQLLLDAGATED